MRRYIYNTINTQLKVPRQSTDDMPKFETRDGYFRDMAYNLTYDHIWHPELDEFIAEFNKSKRYGDLIFCPYDSHLSNDDADDMLHQVMFAHGIVGVGLFKYEGKDYYAWKKFSFMKMIKWKCLYYLCTYVIGWSFKA
jgi:hypothetical protein